MIENVHKVSVKVTLNMKLKNKKVMFNNQLTGGQVSIENGTYQMKRIIYKDYELVQAKCEKYLLEN